MRDDQVVFARGYGMANLEHHIAITPESVFGLQSTSKQFVAMAVVLLIQDGKLAFEDDVRKYLPELPDYGEPITVRHLLEHTSGLRDVEILIQDQGWGSDETLSDDYLMQLIMRQKALNHSPGTAASYTNTGYFLLPIIVERITKERFADFLDRRIFQPLGMAHTRYRDDFRTVIDDCVTGYTPKEGGPEGGGEWQMTGNSKASVFSTVLDLARWNANFDHPVVGGEEAIRWMTTWGRLRTGEQTEWGLGLSPLKYRGLDGYYFSGGGHDGTSVFVRFPDQHFATAILANGGMTHNAEALAPPLIDVVLAEEIAGLSAKATASPPVDTTAANVPTGEIERYVGLYFTTHRGPQTRELRLEAGKPVLMIPPRKVDLIPLGEGRFRVQGATTEYVFGRDRMRRIVPEAPVLEFQRVDSTKATSLEDFTGRFWSDELQAAVTFSVRDGKLCYAFPRQDEPSPLTPLFRDAFADGKLVFRFVRDSRRQVTGVTKHWDRVWSLAFVRERDRERAALD
jgi:CubicO group peptidase (beta-lactamase class C family)